MQPRSTRRRKRPTTDQNDDATAPARLAPDDEAGGIHGTRLPALRRALDLRARLDRTARLLARNQAVPQTGLPRRSEDQKHRARRGNVHERDARTNATTGGR